MSIRGFNRTSFQAIILGVLLCTFMSACCACGGSEPISSERQTRLNVMRSKGTKASLTVFPVAVPGMGETRKDVADVVGLLLEQGGMQELETTEVAFATPTGADFDEAAHLFGEFVRTHPIKTDYALYVEFLGTHQTGPTEIRGVVVDKAGESVWVDRQTRDDADFRRAKPAEPMTCAVLLTKRLRTGLGLTQADANNAREGRMAALWAEKSGTPDKAEWDAMERRQAIMKKAGRRATIAVYPVRLSDDAVGKKDAAHLAGLLNKKKLCAAGAVDSPLRVKIEPARNEQKLLWQLARTFQEHVKRDPPDADYALLADYIMHPRGDRAWAVHFVVCDRDGEWVIVDFQNDHHGDFQSIDAKTLSDCGRLVARRLRGYLR